MASSIFLSDKPKCVNVDDINTRSAKRSGGKCLWALAHNRLACSRLLSIRAKLPLKASCSAGCRYPDFCNWPYTLNASSDRKSTRLNSSHVRISYAVFCLKKKKKKYNKHKKHTHLQTT